MASYTINAVARWEEAGEGHGGVVIQGIERDVGAQGQNLQEAMSRFYATILAEMDMVKARGERLLDLIDPLAADLAAAWYVRGMGDLKPLEFIVPQGDDQIRFLVRRDATLRKGEPAP